MRTVGPQSAAKITGAVPAKSTPGPSGPVPLNPLWEELVTRLSGNPESVTSSASGDPPPNDDNPLWRALALGPAGDAEGSIDAMRRSHADLLPEQEALRFGAALGMSVEGVKVHTDAAADEAAKLVFARAVTAGDHIYFARGAFQPGTPTGDRLLLHELAHVQQETLSPSTGALRVPLPGDPSERAASQAENLPIPAAGQTTPSQLPPPSKIESRPAALHRFLFIIGLIEEYLAYKGYEKYREWRARDNVVELEGHPKFEPDSDLADYIADSDDPVDVHFQFGRLAHGTIPIYKDDAGNYRSAKPAVVPLMLTGLGDGSTVNQATLMLVVTGSNVMGLFGGVPFPIAEFGDPLEVLDVIKTNGTPNLMGWQGLDDVAMDPVPGVLGDGHLNLGPKDYTFELDGVFAGKGKFGINDGTVTFDAAANLQVKGLANADMTLTRNSYGALSGTAKMGVTLGGFEGSLLATFGHGVIDIRGTATVKREGFEGSVTLLVTDADKAWAAVNGELAQWPPAGVDADTPTLAPSTGGTTPAVPAGGAATPGDANELVVAGWGTVDFRYKDWLHGRAQVIVDPEGDITSLGRVHVPKEFILIKPTPFPGPSFSASGSQHIPSLEEYTFDTLSLDLSGSLKVTTEATLGPMILRDVHAGGAFSTKAGFPNHLTLGGTLELRAAAALSAVVTLRATISGQIPIAGHITPIAQLKLAEAQLVASGTAEAAAFVAVDAAIHRTQPTGSGEADYSISGTLSGGGTLSFEFEGADLKFDIFPKDKEYKNVEEAKASKGYHPLKIEGRHFRLGEMHGSVPFKNFKIGSDEPPKPQFAQSKIPRLSGMLKHIFTDQKKEDLDQPQPQKDDPSVWKSGAAGDVVVDEGSDPTPAVIPTDPRFGAPTLPPQAPPAAPQGAAPAPNSSPVDAQPDAGDTGATSTPAPDTDAGQPSDAGAIAGAPTSTPVPPPPAAKQPSGPDVQFQMEGTPHDLILDPGPPPVLIMKSDPEPLDVKLQVKHDELQHKIAAPDHDPQDTTELAVVDELVAESKTVEAEAKKLDFGEPTGEVAGMKPLAQHMQTAGDQFDWHDIAPEGQEPPAQTDVPTPAPTTTTPPPPPDTPPPAADTLVPFDEFLDQIKTLSDQEALPLIEKQRAAYDKEVGRLNKIINSSLKTTQVHKDAEKQRAPLIGYILRLDRMSRRIKAQLSPDGRPELPCLSPDTLVITAAGPVAIGSLREGDTLLTWDPSSGVTLQGVVLEVHRRITLSFVEVRAGGVDIRATGRHPFWVVEQGDWISASNLQVGDHLLMADGSLLPIESLRIVEAGGASTVDLSISPYSTYFVGPGVLVHNTPVRHYSAFWQDDKGNTVQPGPYQIYLGTNTTDPKWGNSIYVGQTVQDYKVREAKHRQEAVNWFKDNPNGEKEKPETFKFFSFKKLITLEVIADGLRNEDQADWLEQKNKTFEESLARDVLNRIDIVAKKNLSGLEDRIKADPIVIASKLC